ncbi:unnamed protein product [Lactuca virosa]|uniref:Uncharacterized protein n=1 Tax=Lactuca virosa TaxID=75947 RepID=A0AAU9MWY5_9ASTR|nr:unnamed protein product [Lactuca virosa]
MNKTSTLKLFSCFTFHKIQDLPSQTSPILKPISSLPSFNSQTTSLQSPKRPSQKDGVLIVCFFFILFHNPHYNIGVRA